MTQHHSVIIGIPCQCTFIWNNCLLDILVSFLLGSFGCPCEFSVEVIWISPGFFSVENLDINWCFL